MVCVVYGYTRVYDVPVRGKRIGYGIKKPPYLEAVRIN